MMCFFQESKTLYETVFNSLRVLTTLVIGKLSKGFTEQLLIMWGLVHTWVKEDCA